MERLRDPAAPAGRPGESPEGPPTSRTTARDASAIPLLRAAKAVAASFGAWQQRRRSILALNQFDEFMLNDIGLNQQDIARIGRRRPLR